MAGTVCTGVVSDQSVEQSVYDAAIVRRFTIKDLRFFAKAGYYRANIDTDVGDLDENGLLLGAGVRWYFDAPVSNSGRIVTLVREIAAENAWNWTAETVASPDALLRRSEHIVVSADSAILDACAQWHNPMPAIVLEIGGARIVDLRG